MQHKNTAKVAASHTPHILCIINRHTNKLKIYKYVYTGDSRSHRCSACADRVGIIRHNMYRHYLLNKYR